LQQPEQQQQQVAGIDFRTPDQQMGGTHPRTLEVLLVNRILQVEVTNKMEEIETINKILEMEVTYKIVEIETINKMLEVEKIFLEIEVTNKTL